MDEKVTFPSPNTSKLAKTCIIGKRIDEGTTGGSFIPRGVEIQILPQLQVDPKTVFQSGFEKGTSFSI